ncbi:MAG: DUF2007 domain-containing protein [Thiotrichaceae bacterium]|nr:DUF2007 domain-containing protein [Thiotrichaceae bacterium]
MKLIYRARDVTEAHIISGLLKSNGIVAHVGGHYLQGGVGDLAAMDFATISVPDENAETAISIIAEYEKNNIQENKTDQNNKSIFAAPFIALAIFVVIMLLLASAMAFK